MERHFLVAYINIRHLCGIHSGHHDMGRELITTYDGLRIRDDESFKSVHTNILHVDVLHQSMQHLALSIAHVTLQF